MTHFSDETPDWHSIPPMEASGRANIDNSGCITLATTQGNLSISFHHFGVRLRFGERQFADYNMLIDEADLEAPGANFIPPAELQLDSHDEQTVISGAGYTLTLQHKPLSFELLKQGKCIQQSPTDGHFVRQFRLPPVARVEQGWFISLELDASEPVYGLGEKWGRLDKRGQLVRSYNHDALGVNAEISYKNTPFAWSPKGWGAFVHTPAPVTHGVGFAPWSQRAYGLLVEDSSMDLFLLAADNGAEFLQHYSALTGHAPIPPLWSLGVILSKAYYQDAEELLTTAREVRKRQMPCDVITLDGRAWQDTDSRFDFKWDAKRYPDPAKIINELKSLNFKICIWEYPLISVNNPLFTEMAEKGWLLKDRNTGKAYRYKWDTSCFGDVLTPLPDSGIVDFTHPDAYIFWRDSHKPLFDLGIDMIKADFGEQIESDMLAYNGDHGHALHNAYTLLYNRCVYEAAARYSQSGPFLFSRSAWTGSQRYPAQWGGDPQADWGGLAASLRGGISWGLSGAPYYATDVGGFYGDQRNAELFVRWLQAAVFSAHIRLHGIGQREPWSYANSNNDGDEAVNAANKALQLRYRLIPYIYQAIQKACETGLPVQRAMVLTFPEDRAAWAFDNQFMLGDKLLVAPCLQAGGRVDFYLPAGQWRQLFTNETFSGCQYQTKILALDEIAVFIREGEQIPLGPPVEHTDTLAGKARIEEYWP